MPISPLPRHVQNRDASRTPDVRPRPKLTSEAECFVSSVLNRRPKTAVFDCDGTLWAGDAGEEFLRWEIKNNVISADVVEHILPHYASYKQGKIGEEEMCGEMVTLHEGLRVSEVEAAAERFFIELVERRIFPEMQELTRRLAEAGCELWAVSSTNEWVIRAGLRRFAIPQERVLAAAVEAEGGIVTARLIQVPTDDGKARAIRKVISGSVDAVFGNSIHDEAMLALARYPYAVGPTAELRRVAEKRQWEVYCPQ